MLWLLLAVSVLMVDAKETEPLPGKDAFHRCTQYSVLDDKEGEQVTIKDPWSPIIGDTEGTRPNIPRVRSWTGSSPTERGALAAGAGRRANNLVENLRRQLMRDNYDYIGTDSAEHSSTTTKSSSSTTQTPSTSAITSTLTLTTTASTSNETVPPDIMKAKFVRSPYFQGLQNSRQSKQYPVARAQARVSRIQVASVSLPVFTMTRVAAMSTIPSMTRKPFAALRPYVVSQMPAVRPYISAQLPATMHPYVAQQPPAAGDSSVVNNPYAAQNPAATVRPSVVPRPSAAAPPSISFHPVNGSVQQFRSFDEAYNTPSPILDQHGSEPKREVFKKDLLYYVDDDRLNNGLHLRRNNYLSGEGNQAQEQDHHYGDGASAMSAQSGQDMTTEAETSQQVHHGHHGQQLRRGAVHDSEYIKLREKARRNRRKSRRRYKRKYRPMDGIKRRARLYGLRPKDYGYDKHDEPRELNRQKMNQHNSEYEPGDRHDNKPHDPYDAPINGQRNEDNFDYRRNNQVKSIPNINPENVKDSQNRSASGNKDDPQSSHENDHSEDQETNSQTDENNDKQPIVNNIHDFSKHNKSKHVSKNKEDKNNDVKKDVNEDNIDNTQKIDDEQVDSEHEEDGRRNNGQHYTQYLEETTSNVKYKLLKVRSLGGSRRSGAGEMQQIIQERGSQGVALISMDQAPFPQFQLPRARRQYMQESGRARHPLREQLPKPTSISRRNYKSHHRSSH